jgi:hypothetical protein
MPLNAAVASWTGWSPTLGPTSSVVGSTSGQLQFNNSPIVYRLQNTFRRTQSRPLDKVWRALTGVVAGSNATVNRERVKGVQAYLDPSAIGGLVQMELQSVINRNTTAADVTYIQTILDKITAPSPYVADSSGNGGGSKLGF